MTAREILRKSRSGFTLVEALLVLAILGILIGMLVPALQRAREASSRLECANNLRRIGDGFQGYHDRHNCFPPGGTHSPGQAVAAPNDRRELWSWAYHILPHIDQKSTHGASWEVVAATPIPAYYCPSRRAAALYGGTAKIDYACNAGSRPTDGADGTVPRPGFGRVRRDSLADGGSATLLVADKQLNLSQFGRAEDDDEAYSTPGWGDFEVYRVGLEPPARDYRSASTAPSSRFGSSHAGGIVALFADGSVRTIRYSVDPGVFLRSCIRSDDPCFKQDDP